MSDILAVERTERIYTVGNNDSHETCVTDAHIYFYDDPDYFGEPDEANLIGDLDGTLVNVAAMDDSPLLICDDISQDLGYVMDIVQDQVKICFFYISQFRMEDKKKAAEIIRNLPAIIFKLMGRRPDLLVSYPDCLPYELDEKTRRHLEDLATHTSILMQKAWNGGLDGPIKEESPLGPNYKMTKEDFDFLMGSGGGYPESAIDREAFDFWKSVGFKEIDDSRVLTFTVRTRR